MAKQWQMTWKELIWHNVHYFYNSDFWFLLMMFKIKENEIKHIWIHKFGTIQVIL